MTTLKPSLCLLSILALFSGCTSTTITNLTPGSQPRNANGLYTFEVAWSSNQQSIRKDTLNPSVVIGLDAYPMQPVPLVKHRWQTLVPVPAEKEIINYRFKFDFNYNSVPVRRPNSKLSSPYQLEIADP